MQTALKQSAEDQNTIASLKRVRDSVSVRVRVRVCVRVWVIG